MVLIEASQQNGLRHNSVALVFQLTAVDKRYITERLGKVSDVVMAQIWSALDALTGRV
jgi:mRNA-degrading endonuclease toxin of MazEF toxin-antitoxin module